MPATSVLPTSDRAVRRISLAVTLMFVTSVSVNAEPQANAPAPAGSSPPVSIINPGTVESHVAPTEITPAEISPADIAPADLTPATDAEPNEPPARDTADDTANAAPPGTSEADASAAEFAAEAAATAAAAEEAAKATAEPEPATPPDPTLLVSINLSTQRMTVTENGAVRHTWPVSSGAFGYPTPTGTFRPTWMTRMWHSRQYDMAPMPHSIFFKGGAAIHATYSVRMLGRPASHGCVRLSPKNAATLYRMVEQHGKAKTEIAVFGKPDYGTPRVAQRRSRPGYAYAYSYGGYFAPPSAYSYGYAQPRYANPGDQRAYWKAQKRRAQQLRKQRRVVVRQYYSGYGYGY